MKCFNQRKCHNGRLGNTFLCMGTSLPTARAVIPPVCRTYNNAGYGCALRKYKYTVAEKTLLTYTCIHVYELFVQVLYGIKLKRCIFCWRQRKKKWRLIVSAGCCQCLVPQKTRSPISIVFWHQRKAEKGSLVTHFGSYLQFRTLTGTLTSRGIPHKRQGPAQWHMGVMDYNHLAKLHLIRFYALSKSPATFDFRVYIKTAQPQKMTKQKLTI